MYADRVKKTGLKQCWQPMFTTLLTEWPSPLCEPKSSICQAPNKPTNMYMAILNHGHSNLREVEMSEHAGVGTCLIFPQKIWEPMLNMRSDSLFDFVRTMVMMSLTKYPDLQGRGAGGREGIGVTIHTQLMSKPKNTYTHVSVALSKYKNKGVPTPES